MQSCPLAAVVQRGAQCTMTKPPSPIRLTITVTPETHAVFKRLADAGNQSLSKAMGDWLGETSAAADFMASKMEQARAEPKRVMREMHAYALGLADETSDMLARVSKKGAGVPGGLGTDARQALRTPSPPRPVIRGGKSPGQGKRT